MDSSNSVILRLLCGAVAVAVVTCVADEEECLAIRVRMLRTSWTTRGDGRNTSRM